MIINHKQKIDKKYNIYKKLSYKLLTYINLTLYIHIVNSTTIKINVNNIFNYLLYIL